MKKIGIVLLLILVSIIGLARGKDNTKEPTTKSVVICNDGVIIPVKRILLLRLHNQYGAIKITKSWYRWHSITFFWVREMDNTFATYESYYQADSSGDFSKPNVVFYKGSVSHIAIPNEDNDENKSFFGNSFIRCGPFELFWDYDSMFKINSIYFEVNSKSTNYWEQRVNADPDLEFAPTKWTKISEVNVFDPRLKWYKRDEKREFIYIPIDNLWNDDVKIKSKSYSKK